MKINVGGGPKKIDGFLNMDIQPWEGATDIVHDATVYPWPFEGESVEDIVMTEFLEHVSFRQTENVLKECYRILKNGGSLSIQVPDIREMMFAYWNGQICECVPHKPKDKANSMAKLDCPKCKGYGKVHPNRWLYAFTGAQKHSWDAHLNIFTPERLRDYLLLACFKNINMGSDEYGWKIKCKATK